MYKLIAIAALVASAAWGVADFAVAAGASSPSGAYAYIGYPNDGQVVPANKPFR
ncbi:ATPase, partial [Mesorhizobium sp. M00.F.Ca.ET.216.01.1.1]